LDNKVFDIIDARCKHEIHLKHNFVYYFILPKVLRSK